MSAHHDTQIIRRELADTPLLPAQRWVLVGGCRSVRCGNASRSRASQFAGRDASDTVTDTTLRETRRAVSKECVSACVCVREVAIRFRPSVRPFRFRLSFFSSLHRVIPAVRASLIPAFT